MSAASADLTSDFHRFYPTSVLETGYDILFFWVARMVMLGMELTQCIPFHTVYLHGLVRDEHGAKMSKTKGNVIDPLQAVEQYGTDALRFTLVTGSTPGFDIPLSKQRLENSRNFVNKLWNTGKYITHVLGTEKPVGRTEWSEDRDQRPLSISDTRAWPLSERYIVSRIHEVSIAVTNALESHEYSDAGKLIHDFLWDEFADWYLEISKTRVKPASFESDAAKHAELSKWVLVYVWDKGLKLLHPYMPFITESLWQRLPHQGPSIMKSDWPVSVAVVPIAPIPDARLAPPGAEAPLRAPVSETSGTIDHSVNWFIDKSAISSFKTLQAVVRTIRNARTNYDVLPSHKITAIILVHSQELVDVLRSEHSW